MAIEKVVYQENGDLNINPSRRVSTVMDGKINEFLIQEIRIMVIDTEGFLGGHWRDYPEVWMSLGKGKVILADIETDERKEYDLVDGSRIFIPSRVASKVYAKKGTCIVTCSPEKTDREKTHKYEFT